MLHWEADDTDKIANTSITVSRTTDYPPAGGTKCGKDKIQKHRATHSRHRGHFLTMYSLKQRTKNNVSHRLVAAPLFMRASFISGPMFGSTWAPSLPVLPFLLIFCGITKTQNLRCALLFILKKVLSLRPNIMWQISARSESFKKFYLAKENIWCLTQWRSIIGGIKIILCFLPFKCRTCYIIMS